MAKELGVTIPIRCHDCDHSYDYHVNDFRARYSRPRRLVAFVIFVVGSVAIAIWAWEEFRRSEWSYLGGCLFGLLALPIMIYSTLLKTDDERLRRFNGHKYL